MMTLNKVFALSIIALGLAACSSKPPSSTLPNTNPTVTNPSNSNQTNNGNAAANNGNSANSGNSANHGNTADSGNTAANNPPPFTLKNGTPNFSVSVGRLKREAEADIRELARKYGVDESDVTVIDSTYEVSTLGQNANGGSLDLSKAPLKQLTRAAHKETVQVRAEGKTFKLTRNGESHIYRQNYSLIAGVKPTSYSMQGDDLGNGLNTPNPINDENYLTIKGTPTEVLPTAGKATYSGAAFDGKKQGVLNYSVDFNEKTGEGNITGLSEKVILNKGSITHIDHNNEIDGSRLEGHGIKGSSNKGDYALGFFGANAEEIVGTVNDGEIGFAGSR
ncbi:factor H binding protein domain-containing protein [Neisseria lactamica]|uniref:factor H binding protein domain-containing protein n=1 Tax=Neisseria lactamica TaxID=486 RepID=UPI001F07F0C6|nr:factor H binding protein domain-containing protein [Neisseria lactamica]